MFVINLAGLEEWAQRYGESEVLPELAELIAFLKEQGVEVASSLDIPEDAPLPFASLAYLNRFKTRLVESGKFEEDEIADIMRHARAYAGGTASAQKRREGAQDPPPDDALAASESYQAPVLLDFSSVRMSEQAVMTPWVQITPKAGSTFEHPRYGKVAFSRDTAERMVRNFQNRVYQEHIPVDAEHDTKLSGALGYYRELRVRGDGAIEARIELTDRGQRLRKEGAFKYFSPEFFRAWKDPGTGETHQDVLVGGAFTTRPFFKDKFLAPLAASEQYTVLRGGTFMTRFKMNEDGTLAVDAEGQPILTDEAKAADAAALAEATKVAASEALAQFREQHGLDENGNKAPEKSEAAKFAEMFPEQARRFAEVEAENARIKAESRAAKFKEIVLGRDGAGDGSKAFLGDHAKHVSHMVSLAEAFGEDSDEVKHYVALNREHAEQSASLFGERGSSASAASQTEHKAEEAAKALAAKESIPFDQALHRVLSENPDMYNEAI